MWPWRGHGSQRAEPPDNVQSLVPGKAFLLTMPMRCGLISKHACALRRQVRLLHGRPCARRGHFGSRRRCDVTGDYVCALRQQVRLLHGREVANLKAELRAKKAEMLQTMAGIPDHSFKARRGAGAG